MLCQHLTDLVYSGTNATWRRFPQQCTHVPFMITMCWYPNMCVRAIIIEYLCLSEAAQFLAFPINHNRGVSGSFSCETISSPKPRYSEQASFSLAYKRWHKNRTKTGLWELPPQGVLSIFITIVIFLVQLRHSTSVYGYRVYNLIHHITSRYADI